MLSNVIVDVTIPRRSFVFSQSRGETGRNLSTRLTEHKRATRNSDINNHIAEHHLQTKHQIDWDSATCITYCTDYYQCLTLCFFLLFLQIVRYILDRNACLLPAYFVVNEVWGIIKYYKINVLCCSIENSWCRYTHFSL